MADNKESVILDVQLDAGKVAEDLGKVTRQMQVLKQEQNILSGMNGGKMTLNTPGL